MMISPGSRVGLGSVLLNQPKYRMVLLEGLRALVISTTHGITSVHHTTRHAHTATCHAHLGPRPQERDLRIPWRCLRC